MPEKEPKAKVEVQPFTRVLRGFTGRVMESHPFTEVAVTFRGGTAWRQEVAPEMDLILFSIPRPRYPQRIEGAKRKAQRIADSLNR